MSQVDRSEGLVGSTGMKAPVKAASTANLTLSGEQTIDGISCVEGDRVLCKDQTTGSENGIYTVSTGTWNRSADFDGSYDVSQGTLVTVANGTLNAQLIFQITTADPITIGTTSITFIRQTVALTLNSVNDTSSTSNTIGTGAMTFTVTAGKSFQPGMWLMIADTAAPSTNSMYGQITSYSGTSLVMNITITSGSGTKTAWVISMSSGGGSNATTATTATNQSGGTVAATTITASSSIRSNSSTQGIGYSAGAGGTGSVSGGAVTINKVSGQITVPSTAYTSGTPQYVLFTNSTIAGTDTVSLSHQSASGTNAVIVSANNISYGAFTIIIYPLFTASDAFVINFNVIKGVTS